MGKKAKKGGKKKAKKAAADIGEPSNATIKLAAPVCSLLEFQLKCTPSTRISTVIERIIERHGGSINELSVCVNRFHPEEIVAPEATLEDCGVVQGECIIYYDFVPTSGALLL